LKDDVLEDARIAMKLGDNVECDSSMDLSQVRKTDACVDVTEVGSLAAGCALPPDLRFEEHSTLAITCAGDRVCGVRVDGIDMPTTVRGLRDRRALLHGAAGHADQAGEGRDGNG
jgi:hypothetical protein